MVFVEKEVLLIMMLFMVLLSGVEFCEGGIIYKVGDSAGWAMIGNVDYNSWASSKTFQVDDVLLFEYDPRYHNVLQVSRSAFHSCDVTAPIATYATGNDSIPIRSSGHYYYICGFVGHCQAGQKVDIRVLKSHQPNAGPIQAPHVVAAPKPTPIGPVSPGPSPNSGESLMRCSRLVCGYIQLVLIFIWVLYQ